ncbi:uncharacterized protein [Littorina saxatilis]|uniref:Uncharacterized protein n=1 Tax=Littorina saxatilis TaxID=31220 RepID=A0AAN9BMZ4_9CAEN
MGVVWVAIWLSCGLVQVCTALQWTSPATLQDNITIATCTGQNITLGWDYNHTAEEHVIDVEWRYRANNGSVNVILATEINGHFIAEQPADQRLEYIPGAGIRLLGVTSQDSGTYSVQVNLNLHGSVMAHVQSANIVVTVDPLTSGEDHLHALIQGAEFMNTTQQHHLILVCGDFNPLWTPRVNVVWTTPENQTLPSTYEQNGQFALAVPNPLVSGEYTCKIDNSSPATLCIPSDSPLRQNATVLVDRVEGRIALMDSEMKTTSKQVQVLKTEKDQMTVQILTLEAEKAQMAAEIQNLSSQMLDLNRGIRLVNGSNEHEGRVEIRVQGTWGTVCDDNWYADTNETTVACRQLGFPTANAVPYTDAHFGQGTGIITRLWGCLVDENSLLDCETVVVDAKNCGHSEDVGIRCA